MSPGSADAIRALALTLTIIAVAGFPAAVRFQGRRWSAWAAVIGCEIYMVSAVAAIADSWHTPGILWYRTPLAIVGGTLMVSFMMIVLNDKSSGHARGGTREHQS